MKDSTELWIVTTLSILTACGVGLIARTILNAVVLNIQFGPSRRNLLVKVHETLSTIISTYMLVVGTYEKCILIGSGLVLEYYLTTLLLIIVYRYIIITSASPNPLPVVVKNWEENDQDEDLHENGDVEANPRHDPRDRNTDGLRRRIGESSSRQESEAAVKVSPKPHSRVMDCLKRSAPSFLGLFLGLHAAIQWLHFAWDGNLTNHHLKKTGLLQDCIIVLQTGPIQGFIIEAFVTFLFEFTGRKLSNLRFGSEAASFFISSCILSAVMTATLYAFINVTGSFANPLLAYALERECLYDVTSVVNHVIVYWFGSLAGAVAFYVIPQEKHFKYLAALFAAFISMYFFTPGVLESNYLFF